MKAICDGKDVVLQEAACFDLDRTFGCGQAFRWEGENSVYSGVAFGKKLRLEKTGETIRLFDTTKAEYEQLWRQYFDLERDYDAVLSGFTEPHLRAAVQSGYGIRLLKQEPWETLCSFILSANNNIPRIKGIIRKLCTSFGDDLGGGNFSFPPPERLSMLEPDELSLLRAGYRTKYVLDAAKKVASDEVSLPELASLPFEEAKKKLLTIQGVGEKVAQCVLLYGFGFWEAFPLDVWMKRVLSELYPGGLPCCIRGAEGLAQQYLFHWRRTQKNQFRL